ncbi:MAG: metallophosphoesterase [Bacteroidales bacterium]|nr:metallophosphoesterase [Candidatus Colimorpha pelethequi]
MQQDNTDVSPIRILHISDFHLNGKYVEDAKTLLNYLIDAIIGSGQQIDLVVFSGDMIDKGGKDFVGGINEAFSTFKEIVIDSICSKLKISPDRFIFTPGNHDVNTKKVNHYEDVGIENESMNNEDQVSQFIKGPELPRATQRIEDVKNFEKEFYTSNMGDRYHYGILASNFLYEIKGKSIGITSLNTVWRYNEESKRTNKIVLGKDQIRKSHEKIKDCQLKLAITHYDYLELPEFEKDEVAKMIAENYDAFFVGHTHSSNVYFMDIDTGYSFLHVRTAGSLIANNDIMSVDFQNAFHIVSYYPDHIEAVLYKQENGQFFNQDKNYGNIGDGSGIFYKKIPSKEESAESAIKRAQQEHKQQEEDFLKRISPFTTIEKYIAEVTDVFFKMDFVTCARIEEIMKTLKDSSIQNIHFLALSGMGKTRIIMEAFKNEDNVFYSPTANCTDPLRTLVRDRPDCTIIVDDCDNDQRRKLKKIIRTHGIDNRLITINNELSCDEEQVDGDVLIQFEYDEAKEVVNKLIETEKGIAQDENIVGIIKEYAGNIPYMAVLMIDAYKNRGTLRIDNSDALLKELLRGRNRKNENQEKVLKSIALFNPLGYSDPVDDEYEYVKNNCNIHHIFANQNIVDVVFSDTINIFLKKRKLIEYKGNCIRIRPKPLAEWLTEYWLTEYGDSLPGILENLNQQDSSLSNRLVRAFSSRIENMKDYSNAKELFDKLHNLDNGFFHDERIAFSEAGSRLFLSMGTVSPVMVAKNIHGLLANRETDKDWLEKNVTDDIRRNLVYALERIAILSKDAFPFVAKSLLILSDAENESFSNNSSGVFVQLFHILLAGTNAPLSSRIGILEENQDKKEYTAIIVRAIDAAFKSRDFSWFDTSGISQSLTKVDNDYNPTYQEVHEYWDKCANILISISERTNEYDTKIRKIVNEHISDYYHLNDIQTLTKLLTYYGEKCNYDWPEIRKTLRYNINYWSKNEEDKVIDSKKWFNLFEPKSFILRVKDAIENQYLENRKNFEQLHKEIYQVMDPYAREFVEKKIYLTDELPRILKDWEFQSHWMIQRIVNNKDISIVTHKEILEAIFNCVIQEDPNFESPFITQYCIELCKKRNDRYIDLVQSFQSKLYDNSYYRLSASIEGIIDDDSHSLLPVVISKYKQGNYDNYCIDNYLRRYSWQYRLDSILTITKELLQEEIDEDEVVFPYFTNGILLNNVQSISDDNILSEIERIVLSYSYMGKTFNTAHQVVELMSDILGMHYRPDFALQVHKKIVSVLSSNKITIHNPFDKIYETLLPKYQNVILERFFEDIAANDDRMKYYWEVHYSLGSGFGYGVGPLFKCDYESLKRACIKYPETLPERMAEMCPVVEPDKQPQDTFFWWLCDNFGDREDMLRGFSGNLGTYSYCGSASDSFADYIASREDILTPYLQHPNKTVQEWAQRQINSLRKEVQYERDSEEYSKMIHQR